MNIVGLFYGLLLEGFAFSLHAISSHRLASISMITSVFIILVVDVTLTVEYLAQTNAGGVHMLRLVNISVSESIF